MRIVKLKNNILKSLTLKADAIDFQGNAVADGTLSVMHLSELSPARAKEVYAQMAKLVQDLQGEVAEAERLGRIAYHEEELGKLKKDLAKLKNKEVK